MQRVRSQARTMGGCVNVENELWDEPPNAEACPLTKETDSACLPCGLNEQQHARDVRNLNIGAGVVISSLALIAGAPELWFVAVPLLATGSVMVALTCHK